MKNCYTAISKFSRSHCIFNETFSSISLILLQLRDSHVKICTELGSDLAYSCYGIFLHSFIAGWEDDEKAKAFQAIKGKCFSHSQKLLKLQPHGFNDK